MRLSKSQRVALHAVYGGRCAYCGAILPERWHADHIEAVHRSMRYVRGVGLVRTGEMDWPERDTYDGLRASCPPCNQDKHTMSLEQWRIKLSNSLGVLQRNSSPYRHAIRFGLLKETPVPIVFYFEHDAAGEVVAGERWEFAAMSQLAACATDAVASLDCSAPGLSQD